MRRTKFIALTTEQDMETACRDMDRREGDALQELDHEIAECDDEERALVLQARSERFEDRW
jgi:hypothetical protein